MTIFFEHVNILICMYVSVIIYCNLLILVLDIGMMVRVFANGPKTHKMVLDASLLNSQHYKVQTKGKVGKSRERSGALPYRLVWLQSKREPSGCPQLWSPITYITCIFNLDWFGLVWFYGISTTVGYLMPNLVYSFILHIYDL